MQGSKFFQPFLELRLPSPTLHTQLLETPDSIDCWYFWLPQNTIKKSIKWLSEFPPCAILRLDTDNFPVQSSTLSGLPCSSSQV